MDPEVSIISNQAPEIAISTTLVVKWSEEVERSGDKIYASLWGVLYKEEDGSLVTWPGTNPDANMNGLNWFKEENYFIVPRDNYNGEFNDWQVPIHNGRFRLQTLKEKINIGDTYTKYAGSTKFDGIPREGKPVIYIKSYKDQYRDHMISNGMWYVFYLPYPYNKLILAAC